MNELERRIEKLERQLRLWRYLGMASILVVGMFFFFAATSAKKQSSSQKIKVKSITMETLKGSIILGANESGALSILFLLDKVENKG